MVMMMKVKMIHTRKIMESRKCEQVFSKLLDDLTEDKKLFSPPKCWVL